MSLAMACENPTKKEQDFATYRHINVLTGSTVHWREMEELLMALI
jgi:hypothetical protein